VSVRVERAPQGTFVCGDTQYAAGELGHERLVDLLAETFAYNLALVRQGAALAVRAALPPLPDLERRRLGWLEQQVERVAGVLCVDALVASSVPSPSPESIAAPSDAAKAADLLEVARQLAAARGWNASDAGSSGLGLTLLGPRRPVRLALRPGVADLLVSAPLPQAAGALGPAVREALPLAVLAQNTRFSFARLRFVRAAPLALALAVEARVPLDACEDELAFAFEGVAHAARAVTPLFCCLYAEPVAREYLATRQHEPRPERGEAGELE
jgi:hypothetical protein